MTGRKRKHNPTIPAHIDQARIPAGVYWDPTGRGRWYVFDTEPDTGPKRRTVATPEARLSDLHAIAEQRAGAARGTLAWLLDLFHKSEKFKKLSARTRSDYEWQQRIVARQQTNIGKKLDQLEVARMTTVFFQRLVDRIEAEGHPTKANQLLRYVRRVFSWGLARGYCAANPAKGVEQAEERKQRKMPDPVAVANLIQFAAARGQVKAHTKGSGAPYLWIVIELAYLLRLRGIEVITLTDAHAGADGVMTNRRKGSRDNIVRWTPRLRAAWDAAIALRNEARERTRRVIPMRAELRTIIVSEDGMPLRKSSLDTAWQRMITAALAAGVITPELRFSLHPLKRRGITDTAGTRADRRDAGGHKSESMQDVYDYAVPLVDTPSASPTAIKPGP